MTETGVGDGVPPVAELEPERPSGSRPIALSALRTFGSLFADTYERTVECTLGQPWSLPGKQRATIERVVSKHCPPEARANPEHWLRDTVLEFLAVSQTNPRLWSSHGPDGLERWLNAGRPGPDAKTSPAGSPVAAMDLSVPSPSYPYGNKLLPHRPTEPIGEPPPPPWAVRSPAKRAQ